MNLFRELSKDEEKEFRQAARSEYQPFTRISELWHPVYCDECTKINLKNHNRIQKGVLQ